MTPWPALTVADPSQLPVEELQRADRDPSHAATASWTRLVHNAYRIEMDGESITQERTRTRHRPQPEDRS